MRTRAGLPRYELVLEALADLPETFTADDMLAWFEERHPGFKPGPLKMLLRQMSVNAQRQDAAPEPYRVLFRVGRGTYRRYDRETHGVWKSGQQAGIDDGDADREEPTDGDGEGRFALEAHLEEFMEENWGRIDFGAPLQIYADDEGNYGRQYETDVGQIDFLCRDTSTDDFVVIELKRDRSSDGVVGQVLRYMGWVHEQLADGRGVRGIIVTHEHDDRLRYAVSMLPNVEAWTYSVSFELNREAPP